MKKLAITTAAIMMAYGATKAQCTFTITGINTSTISGSPNMYFSPQTVGTVPPTTWFSWDFGDGNYDAVPTGSNAVNMYCNAGFYTVNVIAADSSAASGSGCYTTYQTTINVASSPFNITGIGVTNADPSFTFNATTNNPYGLSLSYQWDVDFPYSIMYSGNPVNTFYGSNGLHTVKLDVSYNGCVQTATTVVSVSNATTCFSTPTLVVNNNDPVFNFTLNANPAPSANASYHWNFGDGNNLITSGNTATHTYTSNGSYWVCAWIYDSTGVCTYTSACQNITVNNASPFPLSCNSLLFSAWADSLNPQIWYYTYTPLPPSGGASPYTITSYFWDFGDGNYSNAAYPSYTYAVPGTYNVCLSVTWKDANNDSCVSTSCSTINRLINPQNNLSTGNAKYLYPSTTGIKNVVSQPNVKLYPNPANEFINIQMDRNTSGTVKIYDISGRLVNTYKIENASQSTINIQHLDKGIYIIKTEDTNHNEFFKQTFIKE